MRSVIGQFLIIQVLLSGLFILDARAQTRFLEMSRAEIDSILTITAQKPLSVSERMQRYSSHFLGTPYNLTCVGDGLYALYETMPLVNFRETNCMAFCEHVLALAISDSYEHFFNNLQQIRYQDGIISLKTRNHYTMADWLPENRWLLEDVTEQIGQPHTNSVTRTISHKTFFRQKGVEDLRFVKPDREVTISYIPTGKLIQVKEGIRSGDIGALIFADKDDIFSAHMFIFVK